MSGNTWFRFVPYAKHGEQWRVEQEVDDDEIDIDNIDETHVETGETRETSPNGEQCFIVAPWFNGQTCRVDSTEVLFGIREEDSVWVMSIQIEMLV